VRVRRMASIPAADPGAPAEAVPVQRHSDALPLAATATFDGFYRRELPGLVALAAALAGPASADDIAQEAMLTAYRRWEAVSRLDLPAAWVRRLGARPQRVVELAPEPDAFWAEVRRLPRRQAQAVALAYVYDMGVAEIATTLDIAEGTVKTHLFRGRAALAVRLGEPTDDAAADAGADQEEGGRP
jgi:DNA-directed RNA polymerase specialized sigma24 family protein